MLLSEALFSSKCTKYRLAAGLRGPVGEGLQRSPDSLIKGSLFLWEGVLEGKGKGEGSSFYRSYRMHTIDPLSLLTVNMSLIVARFRSPHSTEYKPCSSALVSFIANNLLLLLHGTDNLCTLVDNKWDSRSSRRTFVGILSSPMLSLHHIFPAVLPARW